MKKKPKNRPLTEWLNRQGQKPLRQGVSDSYNITQNQKKIIEYRQSGLSFQEIAHLLKKTKQAVYDSYRRAIKKYPELRPLTSRGGSRQGLYKPRQGAGQYFVHKLHFKIRPYHRYPKYFKILNQKAKLTPKYNEWRLVIYEQIIDMQMKKDEEFKGDTISEVLSLAYSNFIETLKKISIDYGFEWEKNFYACIEICDGHIEYGESGIARNVIGHIQIKGHDDKVFFTLDKSKGKYHHGYVHPVRHRDDAELLEPYILDLRYNNPPTNTELKESALEQGEFIKKLAQESKETNAGLSILVNILKNLFPNKQEVDSESKQETKSKADYIG